MTDEPGQRSGLPPQEAARIRERYHRERQKRLRGDGSQQYRPLQGALAGYADDPYSKPNERPRCLPETADVVIVGSGFAGILTAVRLLQRGVTDILIIDKAGDFGGTWYWNRYPGAACDIESYIYLPLLEELDYIPTEKYTRQPEIYDYIRKIAVHFGLYAKAQFQTEIASIRWDETSARWCVGDIDGHIVKARFVCMANGNPLHRPKLPGVNGIELFTGKAFHTSRWDYGYTGGDSRGGLTGLADKRVGLIGTGATAVQLVPHLGQWAQHLHVFQRTPSSVDVRDNRPTDPAWADTLTPGWQRRRIENFTALLSGAVQHEDLVGDGWTQGFWRQLQARTGVEPADLPGLLEEADLLKMEAIRARVSAIVKDPVTAEALKPWYRRICKRPCFHDDYLATFNRPNVSLIDTAGRGVDRITATGVVASGQEYALDCLIYATGFEFGTDFTKRLGFEVIGRGGGALSAKWRDGAATLHGMLTRDFPNLLIISMVQAGATPNVPHMLDEQANHAAYLIDSGLKRGARTIEPTIAAEMDWTDQVVQLAGLRIEAVKDCTPGYLNNEGRPERANLRNSFYGAGAMAFMKILADWRAEDQLAGLEFGYEAPGEAPPGRSVGGVGPSLVLSRVGESRKVGG